MTEPLPRYFKPLVKADILKDPSDDLVNNTMKIYGIDRDAAIAKLDAYNATCEHWINDLYQVQLRRDNVIGDIVHLNIRRRDGAAIHDWRHFQAIKNQLVGEECEAIELYPAESRKVDATNKFHLWCATDPTFRFPIGFNERDVSYDDTPSTPGMRQRKL